MIDMSDPERGHAHFLELAGRRSSWVPAALVLAMIAAGLCFLGAVW